MTRFSEEFKYSIVKGMMPPKNESVNAIAEYVSEIFMEGIQAV